MAKDETDREQESRSPASSRELAMDDAVPFGPRFFLTVLRAFVRDRCPDPGEGLPAVQLHLADGERLDVCHIMGIAPYWIALAVNEGEQPRAAPTMRTELVPYSYVARVTIRSLRPGMPHVGFDAGHEPNVFARASGPAPTPEEALRAMAEWHPKNHRPATVAVREKRASRGTRERGGT